MNLVPFPCSGSRTRGVVRARASGCRRNRPLHVLQAEVEARRRSCRPRCTWRASAEVDTRVFHYYLAGAPVPQSGPIPSLGRTDLSQFVVSDCLRDFCAEEEVFGRESIPAQHCSRLGERVESGIDFCSRKNLGVMFQLALGGGGIEDSYPFRVRPAGGAQEKSPRVRRPLP